MQIVKCICPNCNAQIDINDNRIGFCQYCGSKLLIDDGSVNININDKAAVKKQEVLETTSLKELEIKNKKSEFDIFLTKIIFGFIIVSGIVVFICTLLDIDEQKLVSLWAIWLMISMILGFLLQTKN